MMDFCKGVHTLLGFFHAEDRRNRSAGPRCLNISTRLDDGLRIIALETAKPTNVVQKTDARRPSDKPDPGAWGLHECCYDDGLGLCTESLGFESYCDGRVAGKEAAMKEGSNGAAGYDTDDAEGKEGRSGRARSREFPPPLSWLAGDGGWQNKYLVPEKKDGRLVIKLKTVDRPEISTATREDGRFRYHLIVRDGLEEEVAKAEEEEEAATAEEEAATAEEERWEQKGGDIEGCGGCQVAPPWNHLFVTTALSLLKAVTTALSLLKAHGVCSPSPHATTLSAEGPWEDDPGRCSREATGDTNFLFDHG